MCKNVVLKKYTNIELVYKFPHLKYKSYILIISLNKKSGTFNRVIIGAKIS